ncbi:hypothetical protein [Pontibacter saemangeumensis]
MKRIFLMLCMMFGSTFATKASANKVAAKPTGDKATKALASNRAKLLSNQMITGLQLNNYQSRKIQDINMQVAEQLTAVEQQNAGNQAEIDRLSKNIYAERDRMMENVLSTVQYNDYFGHRKDYNELDKKIAETASVDDLQGLPQNATALNQ